MRAGNRRAGSRGVGPGAVESGAVGPRPVRPGAVDLGYRPRRWWGARRLLARSVARLLVFPFFRVRVEGAGRLPSGGAILVFNHLGWADPIVLLAALPASPPLFFFGPREADMSVGGRNRLMRWAGICVPFQPGNRNLVLAVRRVERLAAAGAPVAIAGEGRIHVGEATVGPMTDGGAFLAIQCGVPLVPVAVNGTSWLGFGRTIRVRVGEPIPTHGLDRHRDTGALTRAVADALAALVADAPEPPPPGRVWRSVTELFNDWPEGDRPTLPMPRDPTGLE